MIRNGWRREGRGVGAPRFLGRLWLLASVAVTLAGAHAASEPAAQAGPDSLAIDRWLVSDPLRAEGSHLGRAAERVAGELLKAPIDAAFEGTESDWLFPDRDVEFGPVYWNLVRADSTSSFDLDTLAFFQDRPARAVILAHA
ncbi:MAG: hypothetical protein ACE5HQ_12295, partial [Gemmatimonadota bacterium]